MCAMCVRMFLLDIHPRHHLLPHFILLLFYALCAAPETWLALTTSDYVKSIRTRALNVRFLEVIFNLCASSHGIRAGERNDQFM